MGTPFPVLPLAETIILPSFFLCMGEWNGMDFHSRVVPFLLLPKDTCQALAPEGQLNDFKSTIKKRVIFNM
jgi:hypothetical protein